MSAPTPQAVREAIVAVCREQGVRPELEELLLKKNDAYGNSAFAPLRFFATSDALEQIRVRIDDKLSRLLRGSSYGGEDTAADLAGYLVLLKAAERLGLGGPGATPCGPINRGGYL